MHTPRVNIATDNEIRRSLSYDPKTGSFIWLVDRSFKVRAGDTAGCVHRKSGYVRIGISKAVYSAHHLAWFLMTGSWPPDEVDHRNRKRADNRWKNLRLAIRSQNMANAKKHVHSKRVMQSHLKGAYPTPDGKRWKAQIQANKKRHYLGRFDTEEEAHAAYCAAAKKLHGVFARSG